ncbi:uncharacterized protein C8A04DRAFT_31672 [Dichotomopilus funicola]|uniref:Uncharacterized protein n=1 Tax=Dichotomopilus funicola TaxID=1934379 RepID=A0AAN6UXT8_9PEZI|nr:hypothetical protein C8A04DRAFT_31672 [Dichotomopilus funicola]
MPRPTTAYLLSPLLPIPGTHEITLNRQMCLGTRSLLHPRSNPVTMIKAQTQDQTQTPFTPLPPPSLGLGLGLGMRRPPSPSPGSAARPWAWIGDGWAYEMDAFKIADDDGDEEYERGEKERSEKEKKEMTSKETRSTMGPNTNTKDTNPNNHPVPDTPSSPPRKRKRNIFRRLFGRHHHPPGCSPSDPQRTHNRARWGKYIALLSAEQAAADREGPSDIEMTTLEGVERRRAGTIPAEKRLGKGCGLSLERGERVGESSFERFERCGGMGGNDEEDWREPGILIVQPEKEVDEGIARREGLWMKASPRRRVVVVEGGKVGEEKLAEIVKRERTVGREVV